MTTDIRNQAGPTRAEILDRRACVELLGQGSIGRLSVVMGGQPLIFPVNYRMVGDEVIFRTDEGTKLDAALNRPVAFEVDELDESRHGGWSVVVLGRAVEIMALDAGIVRGLIGLDLEPWEAGEKLRWLRIIPNWITGRRLAGRPVDGDRGDDADESDASDVTAQPDDADQPVDIDAPADSPAPG